MNRPAISLLSDLTRPTPLRDCQNLASRLGIARLLAKMESERPLGNFKSLGGMVAGCQALAHASKKLSPGQLPALVCASDGNHGLAVAAAAQASGARAIIYLHHKVEPARAARIQKMGATIRWVDGTYDDAVDEAAASVASGEGILVPDTSPDPDDPIVGDVMRGYGRIADELHEQLPRSFTAPLQVYVQAGVGGLAASVAAGLVRSGMLIRLRVVEPENAACVAHALATGRVERIPGKLETAAEMLSCGLASAAAVALLRRHHAESLLVSETELCEAVDSLEREEGIRTTPSGAAGLAGLLSIDRSQLSADSTALIFVTEAVVSS